tara:strand:- start:1095 stop:1403 length:309 start_codon:yes stop_codon:yes gene_type:complete
MTKQNNTKRNQLNKPHNQIAKCIRAESITGLLWAYIQLSQHEIKTTGKTETFSGTDLSRFVSLLHQREVDSVLKAPAETDIASVVSWLDTSKQDETETPKQK